MHPADDRARRRALRSRIRAHLHEMLALIAGAGDVKPFRVRARDKVIEVAASFGPPGAGPTAAHFPGKHLSPVEVAVWHALAAGPLPGKALARAVEQKPSPSFRTILANLVAREVLTHDRERGYARGGPRAARGRNPEPKEQET